ncbi:MAG: FAD-dependent oxidoreductase [Labilithrix sp.]|nr:FAD-dependent oxidoreductase [Labilithrix sp.]
MTERIPVLIVGGGIVGLSASLFLARHGVRSCLVERHPTTCIHPRARGVNGRTMELMRELGLDEAIRRAGSDLAPAVGIYSGANVREILEARGEGGWLLRKLRARGMRGQGSKKSPTGPCRCTQEELEPLLLEAARERGVDARFATELVAFEQDAHGVSAEVLDRTTGERHRLVADYLIAADGARSSIRERLGIKRAGEDLDSHQLNIYFRADLGSMVKGREFSMCLVENEGLRGLVVSINNTDRWVLHVSFYPGKGERPEDFPPERCIALVRKAVGIPDLHVELRGISPWQSAVRVAETYRAGRVFLAGDAAHAMPPWGGFGANTGIQDAHNLAWKLATVLRGSAGDELLATYDAERIPIARTVGAIAGGMNDERGLMRTRGGLAMFWSMRKVFPYLTLGYGYTSPAVLLDGTSRPGPGTSELRGRPGTRAPHLWIGHKGKAISTLDLFGTCFNVLAGPDGDAWCEAARAAEATLGIHLHGFRVGVDVEDRAGVFSTAYGVKRAGAVLVRPDGFIAWRARDRPSQGVDGAVALTTALETVLARRRRTVASATSAEEHRASA